MRLLFLFLLSLITVTTNAQDSMPMRKLIVADIETRVPMRNVIVFTGTYRDTTNWRGVCYVPISFDTLTIAKSGYIPERAVPKELRDSTFLIPAGSAISEVTVWGKSDIQDNVDMWKRNTILSPAAGAGAAFDFANMIDARGRRDRKHLRNVRKKFNEMDKYDDDPIVDAYLHALEDEKNKTPQSKK